MKSLSRATIALGFVSALAPAAWLRADIFILRGGGQIEGMLVNIRETPREKYVIKITSNGGGEVTLLKDEVTKHHKPNVEQKEYLKKRSEFADTAEGQWALAEFCKAHNLKAERTLHLERVIQLDPKHVKARQVLGYTLVGGEWKTTEELQIEKGMKKDRQGRWRPPEQIEDLENQKKIKEAEKKWVSDIRRWRGWLDGERNADAVTYIQQIEDPLATGALLNYMKNEKESSVRRLFLEALIRLGTPDAVHAMGSYAMNDDDDEVRATCLDYLAKEAHPGAVDFFIKRLGDKDNIMVNRAGYALGKMRDPRAVRPLIDALVTTHKYQIQTGNGNGMNSTFGSGGGGSFGFGGGGPQIIDQDKQNPEVHAALTALTGVNFDYDERAWRAWLSSQKKTQNVDARRD